MGPPAVNYAEILNCGIERWSLLWGDLMVTGMIIMAAYAVVAVLMFWVAQRAAGRAAGRERWFWRLCGLLFFFMVFNTHFDLHALPTSIGYCLSKSQGWHDQRGAFRMTVMAGTAGFVALSLLVLLMIFARNIAGNLLLVLGVAVIAGFTATKAIGHKEAEQLYAERFYLEPIGVFHMADVIELSGIAIVLLAALWRLVRR